MKGIEKLTLKERCELLESSNEMYRRLFAEEEKRKKPSRFECFTLGFTLAMFITQIAIFVVKLIMK